MVTPPLMVIESSDDLLEKKLNQLLPEKDQITFAYYRNEYEAKGMTIDAFVALSLELLATSEKVSIHWHSCYIHIRYSLRQFHLVSKHWYGICFLMLYILPLFGRI